MNKYILIAGVNGAGKSTLYQTLTSLADIPRVNTDEIVKEFGDWRNPGDVAKAGKIAIKKIQEYFEQGITFNQETTLCGASIIRNIKRAKERIVHRVTQGGHGIPDADVERRFTESFLQLMKVIEICDMVILYDNTEAFKRFAIYKDGQLCNLAEEFPDWYRIYCCK